MVGKVLPLLAAVGVLAAVPGVAGAAPSNDDFAHPVAVVSTPFTVGLDTSGATWAQDDPGDCYTTFRSMWFRYTPPTTRTVTATTVGSDHNTYLGVYTGNRGALTRVACGGSPHAPTRAAVTFTALAGTVYYLRTSDTSWVAGTSLVFSLS